MAATECRIEHLVVDSGAFIKAVPLHDIGRNFYTCAAVLCESKDRATIRFVNALPYELIIREPSTEAVRTVTEFSKKTGDYVSLSANDIRVLALTCDLHNEFVGADTLRSEPTPTVKLTKAKVEDSIGLPPGFYTPSSKQGNSTDDVSTTSSPPSGMDNDFDDDDDVGWIGIDNLRRVIKDMRAVRLEDTPTAVACLTTDFAMQNVLIQMGMRVASVDGLLIKNTKTFILRCYGCFKTTSIMTARFCPHCGNPTLKRVSVCINEDGVQEINLAFRRPINTKGMRFSLPLPRGGKHATDPVLCADQPIPQNRPSRLAKQKMDILNFDYVAGSSPFTVNDVYSRAAILGNHGRRSQHGTVSQRNPNLNRRNTGNKKK